MPISVLVVDDSSFFRQQIITILRGNAEITVVGTASHGREAVDKALQLKPDVITMDYEMPVMDGISAVREIMAKQPTAILMLSSLTTAGARVTLDALDAGALDYLPKFRESITQNEQLKKQLVDKIIAVARQRKAHSTPSTAHISRPTTSSAPVERKTSRITLPRKPELIMIGTSTGGPVALQRVLTQLPGNIRVPILLIQHMPEAFTGPFAERLDRQCQIRVAEAKDGSVLEPGLALLAPGGKQMMLSSRNSVRIVAGDERLNYKPSVDLTFSSAIKYYSDRVLAVVLTGMGADGRDGARLLKQAGAHVWTQDSASCVIDGMPASVRNAGLSDADIPLDDIAKTIVGVL
ncbi:chemotaxis response regulator protein-glutamate methylesterase [Salinispirillum marinum]|uniref:Protein-glutamate methylesterase/protein-glutamine glutaminase n=2 Tax=Saccharospirillaceae TaxID=255527 RepID=A0ABV8BGD6_9GAMM